MAGKNNLLKNSIAIKDNSIYTLIVNDCHSMSFDVS